MPGLPYDNFEPMTENDYKASNPFGHFAAFEAFVSILKYYVDLNCFAVLPDPKNYWISIHYHQRPMALYDLEKKYHYTLRWDRLTDEAYEAEREGRPLLVENLGFYDVFVPIRSKGGRMGTLLSGAFADQEVTYEKLRSSWKALSGQTPSPDQPDFRQFARVMLETPVLEGAVLEAYSEALKCLALILTQREGPSVARRLRELETGVFSKHFEHSYWMAWALGLPARQATPAWSREVQGMDWVQEEIGISRIPTTVITAVPAHPSGHRYDAVEEMLRIYRFQRMSFRFARSLPQTSGGKLENYGAVFVTSVDSSKTRAQQRNGVMETADRIRRFAEGVLGGPVLIGVGETVNPGESLYESYRQAVLALHLGRRTGKNVVPFRPSKIGKSGAVQDLMRLLDDLKRQMESVSFSGWEVILEAFLKRTLMLSLGNPEETRWHFIYALQSLKETVRRRSLLPAKEASRFHEGLLSAMEKAGTTQEMVTTFRTALEKCLRLMQGGSDPGADRSIEKTRRFVGEHFRESIQTAKLAKKAGVSAATLSRWFKKSTGTGMELYVQNLRLEEAKRLLRTGSMPVSKVASSCGYGSSSYFTRFFKTKTGTTPQRYRQKFITA
jgi:AraC-like DNA-binding protein